MPLELEQVCRLRTAVPLKHDKCCGHEESQCSGGWVSYAKSSAAQHNVPLGICQLFGVLRVCCLGPFEPILQPLDVWEVVPLYDRGQLRLELFIIDNLLSYRYLHQPVGLANLNHTCCGCTSAAESNVNLGH